MASGTGLGEGSGRKVGDLATAAGLTVRTLHYYEEIGLLVASDRSPAGHRLYSDADVERLYRICLLRRLGLPLGEIGRALDDPAWSLHSAMTTHLQELDRRIEATSRLRGHLGPLVASTAHALGAATACMAVMVDDVDEHFRHASEHGADVVYEPVDQPYGCRQYSARDSEGGLWSFMKPLD